MRTTTISSTEQSRPAAVPADFFVVRAEIAIFVPKLPCTVRPAMMPRYDCDEETDPEGRVPDADDDNFFD